MSKFGRTDVDSLFKMQEKAQQKVIAQERGESYSIEPIYCPETLLILDDVIDSGVISMRTTIDKIAERGRHVKLSCIISSQRMSPISKAVRTNTTYFISFSPRSLLELEQFMEEYITKSITAKKDLRRKIVDTFKKKYEFILVDNTETDLTKKLYTSNADDFIKNKRRPMTIELD